MRFSLIAPLRRVTTTRCPAEHDSFRCLLPEGHKQRHRAEEWSKHPTYRSTWVVTWSTRAPDLEPLPEVP